MQSIVDEVYCYPGTDVLVNKYGERDAERLSVLERNATALRAGGLCRDFEFRTFGEADLKRLHGYLFQDVYDWAGEYRSIDIFKGYTDFVSASELSERSGELFGRLEDEKLFRGLSRDDFSERFAGFI